MIITSLVCGIGSFVFCLALLIAYICIAGIEEEDTPEEE